MDWQADGENLPTALAAKRASLSTYATSLRCCSRCGVILESAVVGLTGCVTAVFDGIKMSGAMPKRDRSKGPDVVFYVVRDQNRRSLQCHCKCSAVFPSLSVFFPQIKAMCDRDPTDRGST